jgi:RNA polymerase subunit RPABC4/transcription elongation factor Spt4
MTTWRISGWKICRKCKEEFFAATATLCPICKSKKYDRKRRLRLRKER